MFTQRSDDLASCWKAAASRGARPTALDIGLTVEPLGDVVELAVTGGREDDRALAACVQHALAGWAYADPATRSVRLTAQLVFVVAGRRAWRRGWRSLPPARPRESRVGTVCTPVLDDGAIAELRLPRPLEVSDQDPSREPRPPPGTVPRVQPGCSP